jgi:NAD(P)-dependent dehydrogenase (short-subunit alcohol dehydrogenase family)
MTKKIWFITGSSRGLGRNLTEAVLANGDKVVATARNISQLNDIRERYGDQVFPFTLDVTNLAEIHAAVSAAMDRFGRIDVLVNNAGFGITGATEAFTTEQVRSQLEVNLYAPIEVTRAVLPYMREQRRGRILQISSVAGRVGNPALSIYQAAKFGLSGFSEALSKEVAPLGIHVTSVEPGGFRTDWAGASMSYAPHVEGYASTVDATIAFLLGEQYVPMGDGLKAAQVLIDLASHPRPPLHLILGSDAVGLIKQAEEARMAELEEWLPVSMSTDYDGAVDFSSTELGKKLLGGN